MKKINLILLYCGLFIVGTSEAVLVNVSFDTNAKTERDLDGPIYGSGGSDVGTTWNQILHEKGWFDPQEIARKNLLDATGASTTVDFETDSYCMWPWGSPDLTMLTSGLFAWESRDVQTMKLSGLTSGQKYDLYLASFHPNGSGNRALFSTTNPTSTSGTQIVDSGGSAGNNSTWMRSENFAVFEDVEPNANNEIIVTYVSDSDANAYLSGFQLATANTAIIPPGKPFAPSPSDGEVGLLSNTDLSWTTGDGARVSRVYFGTDPTPDSGELKGDQAATSFDPGPLAQGTYYWQIVSVNSDGTEKGPVWRFSVGTPGKATNPFPYDGAGGTDKGVILNWDAGENAISSDLYFGTDPTPDTDEFRGNQTKTTYDVGTLNPGTTYYWRVDQVNTEGTTTGDVWSFTTVAEAVVGRNTFLVPLPSVGASWKDLAYLAAIPASVKINTGGPSVIALGDSSTPEQVSEYLRLYNPANIYTVDTSGSLDEVACSLAQTHWGSSARVVLCNDSDYAGALAASALAGRLEVPILFFNSSSGLSADARNIINNHLNCASALTIAGNNTVTSQLAAMGVSQTSLANDKAIISWMENNGYPVEYLAVCNTYDREITKYAPKGSLAAALLAAERNGAVAALHYETAWNKPFFRSSTTTVKPRGLPANTEPPRKYHDASDLEYDLGSFTLNGATHNFVVARMTNGRQLDAAFIDFNNDGDFGDAGEYCPRTSELSINDRRYTLGVNASMPHPYAEGELRLSYPSDDKFKEDLQTYHDQIGRPPKYMAMVGIPQVLPCAHALSYDRGWCDYVMNDNYYADIDDDPLFDIAVGRIVGRDVSFFTLHASRCLTYEDLQYQPAADRVYHQCTDEFADRLFCLPRKLENCGYTIDEWLTVPEHEYKQYSIFIQDEHGWPFGIARDEFPRNCSWSTVGLVSGGGCNMASMDMFEFAPEKKWYDSNAVVLTGEGAVGFNAWVRGTGSGKTISRDAFYSALLDGASMGEAHRQSLNILMIKDTNALESYTVNAHIHYGDPAVKLFKPTNRNMAAARVSVNGSKLTVHAPETYWVDRVDVNDKYVYSAPGLVGLTSEREHGTFFASYTTSLQINGMTQQSGVPDPLGWMQIRDGRNYVVDEHWDGTRTIYWRVRFEQFNEQTGQFERTINQIDYTISTSGTDTQAPTPNPAQFSIAPKAISSSAITMTAVTGSDPSGPVEYKFDELTGHLGASSSAWTTNPVYTDTGLLPNTEYRYVVRMRDVHGNTGNTSASLRATTPSSGAITRQVWTDVSGTAVSDLTDLATYPNNPDIEDGLMSFEAPTDWAENYGARIVGYLHPPKTGVYTFWMASDDNGELWLSTDDSQVNKQKIASVPDWTAPREWSKFESQQSAEIRLEAGKRYFIEAIFKEASGGDHLAVAWQIPNGSLQVISGDHLSPYKQSSTATYAQWATTNGVGAPLADDDGDGRNNLYEYALGGNPKSSTDAVDPTLSMTGTNIEYRHKKRNDDSSLNYRVEVCTNLVSGVWIELDTDSQTHTADGSYDEILRRVPVVDPQSYIRLIITVP